MTANKKLSGTKPPEETKSDATRREENVPPREHGGPKGPEPTRYGDWERKGRCFDF